MSRAHVGANGILYVHMVANGNTWNTFTSCNNINSYFRRQLGIKNFYFTFVIPPLVITEKKDNTIFILNFNSCTKHSKVGQNFCAIGKLMFCIQTYFLHYPHDLSSKPENPGIVE